jgi:hypothetical protein
MTREWLAGWFVASIAGLIILRTHASLAGTDVQIVGREAGVRSVIAFVYAITWEVAGRIRKVPLAARGFAQPAPLLLYLGLVLLVGAASLLGLTAGLPEFQKELAAFEYLGAASLWIPIGLLTVLRGWQAFPREALAAVVPAFIAGNVLGVPGFLLRAGIGQGLADALNVVAVVALAGAAARWWRALRTPLASAAVGAAAALGLAVGMHRRILVGPLSTLLTMIAGFTKDKPLRAAADHMFWQAFPGNPALLVPWGAVDQFVYYVIATVLALGVAALVARRWTRPPVVANEAAPPAAI